LRQQRRTASAGKIPVSFILAFAYVMALPSMAGSVEGSLPGIGTFTYGAIPAAIVLAAR
jgi:uncharacterized transporter YbjL